ncbi:MAG: acyltransferase [Sphingobium sp.]|nr:acyltransferase [Sphingobium sp.]
MNHSALSADKSPATKELRRLSILDGWRALSITLVMAGHLLPLGINEAVAGMGMVIFFTLSGFLITRFLIEDGNLRRFAIRRILRILPLSWAGALIAMGIAGGTIDQLVGNLFFYANLPPFHLLPAAGHFWSLSVEVQFYAAAALLVALGGQRALLLLPLLGLAVTALRVADGQYMNIVTWYRVDEILAGASLALIYEGKFGEGAKRLLAWFNPFILLPILLLSAHDLGGPLNYVRPYLSALMVGASLFSAPQWLQALSRSRPVVYVANISFALYVFHGLLASSWLGSGDTLIKYAKRPLLIAATFASAHLSTFHYERYWISLGHRLTRREPGGKGAHATARTLK